MFYWNLQDDIFQEQQPATEGRLGGFRALTFIVSLNNPESNFD